MGVVLLPVWYVGAWLALSRLTHDGIINGGLAATLAPAFSSVRQYSGSELPGSHVLYDVWWTTNPLPPGGWFSQFTPDMLFAPCDKNGQMTILLDREPFRSERAH